MFWPKDRSTIEIAQMLGTAMLPVIALCGLVVAILTIRVTQRLQREQTARNAYIKYLEITLAHPEFAFPIDADIDLSRQTFNGSADLFRKYEWFASVVLNTCSFIWENFDSRHTLSSLAEVQVAYHHKYLLEFKEKKNFVKLWLKAHPRQIDNGINFGQNNYS